MPKGEGGGGWFTQNEKYVAYHLYTVIIFIFEFLRTLDFKIPRSSQSQLKTPDPITVTDLYRKTRNFGSRRADMHGKRKNAAHI